MKKLRWQKIFRSVFSPKKSEALAQEKAASSVLKALGVLLFLPFILIQFIVSGVKLAVAYPVMLVTLVLHEKMGIKGEKILGAIMFALMILALVAGLALLGLAGRAYLKWVV